MKKIWVTVLFCAIGFTTVVSATEDDEIEEIEEIEEIVVVESGYSKYCTSINAQEVKKLFYSYAEVLSDLLDYEVYDMHSNRVENSIDRIDVQSKGDCKKAIKVYKKSNRASQKLIKILIEYTGVEL